MIDVKELRVGNVIAYANNGHWVDDVVGKPVIVGLEIIEAVYYRTQNYCPIPLTIKLLEKCGFVKYDGASYWRGLSQGYEFYHQNDGFPIVYQDGAFYKYFDCEDDMFSWTGRPLNSLHDLQNLYFCLIGKELEINIYSNDSKSSNKHR